MGGALGDQQEETAEEGTSHSSRRLQAVLLGGFARTIRGHSASMPSPLSRRPRPTGKGTVKSALLPVSTLFVKVTNER